MPKVGRSKFWPEVMDAHGRWQPLCESPKGKTNDCVAVINRVIREDSHPGAVQYRVVAERKRFSLKETVRFSLVEEEINSTPLPDPPDQEQQEAPVQEAPPQETPEQEQQQEVQLPLDHQPF